MTDTHTTIVKQVFADSPFVSLPPDGFPVAGEPVTVVRGTAPAGMVPDGNGGAYGPGRCLPSEGYEWRNGDGQDAKWHRAPRRPHPHQIVQCRPVPDPQPRTERVPWHQALGRKLPHGGTVRELHKDEGLAAWASSPAGDSAREDADGMVEVLVEDDR